MNTTEERWDRFLNPDVVRTELFSATLYITTFEILTDSIVERIRDYYTNHWDETGPRPGPEYEREVLSRSRSPLYASLAWLQEHEAIEPTDLNLFEDLKKVRNTLAHELFAVVTGQKACAHAERFPALIALLRKIEVWWVVNVEIPTNPDFADQEIDEAGIVPGAILSLQMLFEVAAGNTALLEEWRRGRAPRAEA